jgi:hypothetical protein
MFLGCDIAKLLTIFSTSHFARNIPSQQTHQRNNVGFDATLDTLEVYAYICIKFKLRNFLYATSKEPYTRFYLRPIHRSDVWQRAYAKRPTHAMV